MCSTKKITKGKEKKRSKAWTTFPNNPLVTLVMNGSR